MAAGIAAMIAAIMYLFYRSSAKKPAPTPTPTPTPGVAKGQHLTLVVQTTQISAADIAAYLAAQNLQLSDPAWLAAYKTPAYIDKQPGGWPVYLMDNSDVPDALGYHDFTNGAPYAKVFVLTSQQDGSPVTKVASHEVLEMLADPGPVFKNSTDAAGNVWAYEACDPVEDQVQTFGGVALSDYVLPAWYVSKSVGPWDANKVLSHDHGLTAGGYAVENNQQVYGPAATPGKHTDAAYRRGR